VSDTPTRPVAVLGGRYTLADVLGRVLQRA